MTLVSLLTQEPEALGTCVHTAPINELRSLFSDIWSHIRAKSLYGGQPRSGSSIDGLELARLAYSVAVMKADDQLLLESWCMLAYTLNANEQYAESIEYYRLAIDGLERSQDFARAARSRLGYVTALSMVGRHDEAIQVAASAQSRFLSNGDEEGLARVCVNLGNVYHRLDQHAKSFEYHQKAIQYFTKSNNEQALGQAYLNAGNALGFLDRFVEADEFYAASEQIGERLGVRDLQTQARYNRAYLYFLRGRMIEAVDQFGKLRLFFKENDSRRHAALCDLDETEIYLQLNLPNDAAQLARSAIDSFAELGMRYEHAKATAFLGVALTQNRQFGDALQVFRSTQSLFEEEHNRFWVAVSQLYRAEVLYAVGRLWEARSLATAAHAEFATLGMTSKQMISTILLGKIALDLNQESQAAEYVRTVREQIKHDGNPLLLFPSYAFCAYAAERAKQFDDANQLYELAAREIENRRTFVNHDELRILFFPGKQAVYEALLRFALGDEDSKSVASNAYGLCQRAKSTAMADLVAHHLSSIKSHGDEALLSRISRIRDELNNSYLRLRSEKADMPVLSNVSSIEIKESELLSNLKELSSVDPDYVSIQGASVAQLDQIQLELTPDVTLVEFFTIGNEVAAFVVTRDHARIFRHLSPLGRVRYLEDQLRNHLSKVHTTVGRNGADIPLNAEFANAQLGELYARLIRPLRQSLQTPGLIIVPHGVMHYIPFAALFDGDNYLLDLFDISHSPNTSLLRSSLRRKTVASARQIVLSGPVLADNDGEFIALRKAAPNADWFSGASFTRDRMMANPLECDFIHISTDVTFRHDNPMFSCLRCNDSWITAVDLYSMSCAANVITVIGNMSGLNPATGSESMMTITEAFLYAGARTVLTSLWNVDSHTVGDFMATFYGEWQRGATRCAAARQAALKIREARPHPFFWGSYVVTGQR